MAVFLLLQATRGFAAPVPIVNAGFEDLYFGNLPVEFAGDVPPTAFPVGPPPNGWSTFGAVGGDAFVGVLNPGVAGIDAMATNFPAGAPEGDNVALLFFGDHQGGAEFGIEQTLNDTLQLHTTYTLSVEVGNIASGQSSVAPFSGFGFFDLRGFPGYRVELLAGGTVIAVDDNSLLPVEGEFLPSTTELIVGGAHPQEGQPLGIRLVSLNQQDLDETGIDLEVDFDAVVLNAVANVSADFDSDGDVDGDDFLIWQGAFRTDAGASRSEGDANGDGDVDGDDFLVWQQNFGSGLADGDLDSGSASARGTSVPEPTTIPSLVAIALALAATTRTPQTA